MTPEELATIPDPVPGGGAPGESRAQGGQSPGRVATAPDGAPGATATGRGTEPQKAADSSVTAPGGGSGGLSPVGVWRVQIFAAAERAQADRVAREAAERLGVAYVVQQEGGLYKVRLGAFAREVDAQGLRERALRAGFPGAFRVHTEGEASGGSE
jgi:cell division septation protein DedD